MTRPTLLTVLILLFIPFMLDAQGWEKSYDGGFDENSWDADRTTDGKPRTNLELNLKNSAYQ